MQKKRFVIILAAILMACILSVSVAPTALAAPSVKTYDADAYQAFTAFATSFSNRTVGTESEHAAANWIAQQLVAMGYTAPDGSALAAKMCVPFTFSYQDTNDSYATVDVDSSSYNVLAYKRSAQKDAPLLIISAPYSNEYDTTYAGAALHQEDAAFSATSVAVLLSVASKLMTAELSYDVLFAAVGAEYFMFAGTEHLLSSIDRSILGAIYLSQVGVGDELNIYYDEVSRAHQQFVDGIIAKYDDFDIHTKPFDPGYSMQAYGGNLPYSHVGLLGGNCLYMREGVPSIHLFGYHWAGGTDNAESATHGDIIGTDSDTYANFVKVYGEQAIRDRLNMASRLVTTVMLTDRDFTGALHAAKNDTAYTGLIGNAAIQGLRWSLLAFVVIVTVVMAVLLMRRSKQAGVPDFSVNSQFINGQEGTAEDDVFGEYGAVHGDSSEVDNGEPHDGDDDHSSGGSDPYNINDIFGEF